MGDGFTEWVIDGDDKDLAGILEVLAVDVAGNVRVGAAWREGRWDTNDDLQN